jgi:hypothetical protein
MKGCGTSWLKRSSSYEATLHSEKVSYIKELQMGDWQRCRFKYAKDVSTDDDRMCNLTHKGTMLI